MELFVVVVVCLLLYILFPWRSRSAIHHCSCTKLEVLLFFLNGFQKVMANIKAAGAQQSFLIVPWITPHVPQFNSIESFVQPCLIKKKVFCKNKRILYETLCRVDNLPEHNDEILLITW